jgi:hypothetical protein
MKPRCVVMALVGLGLLLSLAPLGRAHPPARTMSWDGQTSLPAGESVADLNQRANDRTASQRDRARAVFTLFARHIRPHSSEAEAHRVLGNAAWLKETNLEGERNLLGLSFLERTPHNTTFYLTLFPHDRKRSWSPWGIEFSLSGKISDADANAFLRGDKSAEHVRLLEFALFFPPKSEPYGRARRCELFSSKGIWILDPSRLFGAHHLEKSR